MERLEMFLEKLDNKKLKTQKRKCDGNLFCDCIHCEPSATRHRRQINQMHKFIKQS